MPIIKQRPDSYEESARPLHCYNKSADAFVPSV